MYRPILVVIAKSYFWKKSRYQFGSDKVIEIPCLKDVVVFNFCLRSLVLLRKNTGNQVYQDIKGNSVL